MSSSDEMEFQFPEFNEMTDMDDPHFELGMLFTSGQTFRAAVRKHAIVHQRPIRLKKNLADKIKWICQDGCSWKYYGIKQQRSESIQIKTLYNTHTCNPTWEQKCVNSTWIANEYEDEIRMNPTWPTQAFHSRVVNDLKCKISLSMIYRALKKAKENILGKHEIEFAKLFAYANEIKKQMPTSTVKIMSEPAESGMAVMRFKRFYVCLGPLKEGFLDGCRPLIGLDGCHLKGPLGGILLTAVATDPNDGMYPLAWAQVEGENNDSWEWFIRLLKEDLRMENTGSYTFISDRQKGLVNALDSQVPKAEHRFCVMHLYKNLWSMHKGIGVRRLLWSTAKSTTDYHYNMNMEALKKLAPRAYDWLAGKPKSQWSRSAFRVTSKSEMFVNNNCEVFNHAINKYREMGIVTMMKSIQNKCMERICKRLTRMEQKDTIYCNKPLKKLHKAMEMAGKARPSWNGGNKYLVTMTEGGHQLVCDLQNHTCACRKWQLTGIPCFHACACIFFQKQSPLDYMHQCHKREWYLRIYSHTLEPLNGEEFWEETFETPILPPKPRIAPGRPKKKRDKTNDIVQTRVNDPTMMKRTGTSVKCTWCKQWGHNSRTCKTKIIDMKKKQEEQGGEDGGPEEEQEPKQRVCSQCKLVGHNKRTCTVKICDTKEDGKQPISGKKNNGKQPLTAKKPTSQQVLPAKLQLSPDKRVLRSNVGDSSHGGIIRTFKAPSQINGPLGVEPVEGQKFTNLKNLEAARSKLKKRIGRKE